MKVKDLSPTDHFILNFQPSDLLGKLFFFTMRESDFVFTGIFSTTAYPSQQYSGEACKRIKVK